MKVILIEDIKKLGKKDEIKELKDGYASFLINEKKAVPYSSRSFEILENQIEKRKQNEEDLINECNIIKSKIEKTDLKFKLKTGASDKVFGSVSTKNISDKLKELGYDIDKKKIVSDGEINSLGYHNIKINLHKKVIANIRIEVIKEK